MRAVRRILDRALLLYLVVGISNYIVCTALMFFLFNVAGVGEHVAPLVNYGLGSVISYLGCKYFVFPWMRGGLQLYLRYVIGVLLCYVVSYYLLAPPVARYLLEHPEIYDFFGFGGGSKLVANCEMAVCSLIFAVLNYFGQRYFVFSRRFEYRYRRKDS